MENGLIQSPRAIFWSRKEKSVFIGSNKSKGDIPITTLTGNTTKEAFYCETCNNIIITELNV